MSIVRLTIRAVRICYFARRLHLFCSPTGRPSSKLEEQKQERDNDPGDQSTDDPRFSPGKFPRHDQPRCGRYNQPNRRQRKEYLDGQRIVRWLVWANVRVLWR